MDGARQRAGPAVTPSVRRWSTSTVAFAVAVLVAAGVLPGCSGDDSGRVTAGPIPLVDQVEPAIDAVVAELGGPQEFFEVNADARLVNLFVAVDDGTMAVAYVYLDGELQAPAPPRAVASGFTFSSAAVEFDPDQVLSRVSDELPGSTITRFVLLGGPGSTLRLEAIVTSRLGGVLAVGLAPDGGVLEVVPL